MSDDDLGEDQPWSDPQIPIGIDGRRVYTRAVAVGGARRRRRRRRRTVGITILSILVLAPAVGLATHKGHGPQVVVAGHGATSTTTRPIPPTTLRAPTGVTLAVGDSVMLGAEQSLQAAIPGIFVDAKVSRQFWDATSVLSQYRTEGILPATIVIDVGSNGAFSDAQFADMMSVVGDRTIFFVNVREPRTWETEVNQRLASNVRKYPNAHLIDWHDQGNRHSDWFVSDGIHLSAAGAQGYAELIRDAVLGAPTAPATSTSTLPTTAATSPTTTNAPTTTVAAGDVVRIVANIGGTFRSNQQERLTATAVLGNGKTKTIKATWSVSDPTIAPLTADGSFGPSEKSGTVVVTASYQPSRGGPPITDSATVVVLGPSCTTFTVAHSPITGSVC